jgi:hypothetical protein
MLIEHRPCHLN